MILRVRGRVGKKWDWDGMGWDGALLIMMKSSIERKARGRSTAGI